MSQENVEIALRIFDAYTRRDFDAALVLMDPEVEAHNPPEVPEAAIHRGREAVKRDWEQTLELFDDFSVELEEYFDAGDDLLVYLRYRGRSRGSSAEVVARMAHVWTFRDGKVIRFRQFLDRAEARAAVRLSEQDAHADS
jgi:ketosteroid isomerase-like protein